jgi:hypothetical protein
MDPDLCLYVPADFDDSDADARVHPVARLMFRARTNAEACGQAQQWVSAYNVFLLDVSWDYASDEPEPITLSIYFQFDDDPAQLMQLRQPSRLRAEPYHPRLPRARSPRASTTHPTRHKPSDAAREPGSRREPLRTVCRASRSIVTCDCPPKCPPTTLIEYRSTG